MNDATNTTPSNLRPSTIRPGLLCVLKTSITGNVTYTKETLDAEYQTDDGKKRERWETERTVAKPEEYETAVKVRSKIRTIITGVCSQSQFGLLCPQNKTDKLDQAIKDSRTLAEDFNSTAEVTRIGVYVIAGKVADSDVEAIKAINSEVSELMQTMEEGLAKFDVKKVREAADKARSLGAMLSDDASSRLKDAIDVARKAARDMVKAAEVGKTEMDLIAIQKITAARTAFLDHGDAVEVGAPIQEGRALDLAPIEEETPIAPAPAAPTVDIEV